jgi:hypothetical protein
MSFFQKFTTKHVYESLEESIEKFNESENKDEQCNPDAPLTIMINGKKHFVLSIGGDPDEEGLILECKPESYWK